MSSRSIVSVLFLRGGVSHADGSASTAVSVRHPILSHWIRWSGRPDPTRSITSRGDGINRGELAVNAKRGYFLSRRGNLLFGAVEFSPLVQTGEGQPADSY